MNSGAIDRRKPPMAPEWYLVWSLFLTPIAGAIFASMQLWRLNKTRHLWWIWPLSILAFVLFFVLIFLISPYVALCAVWICELIIYWVIKQVSRGVPWSVTAVIIAVVLAVVTGSAHWTVTRQSGYIVQIGTAFDKNSPNLAVSGTDYRTNETLYIHVGAPEMNFGTSKLTFTIDQKVGNGWSNALNQVESVNPSDNYYVLPITVHDPGTYRFTVSTGTHKWSTTITVH